MKSFAVRSQFFIKPLQIAAIILMISGAGCAFDNLDGANVKRVNALPNKPKLIETDTQGGAAYLLRTPSFGVNKIDIGGNYSKKTASSRSFRVTGGINGP